MKFLSVALTLVVIPALFCGCSGCVNSSNSIDARDKIEKSGEQKTTSGSEKSTDGGAKTPAIASEAGGSESGAKTGLGKTKAADLSDECRESHRELRALRLRIPFVFHDLKRSTKDIDKDVREAISIAEKFLVDCSPTEIDAWVKSFLARDLSTRYKRYQSELKKSLESELAPIGGKLSPAQREEVNKTLRAMMRDYLARIDKLCAEGLADSELKSVTHCNCLGVLADKDFTFTRKFEEFRKNAFAYVNNGCDSVIPNGQDYDYSIGMSYVMEGLYQEAQEHFEKVIKKKADSPEVVLYNIGLWEALYALGDLESGQALLMRIRDEYGKKLDDKSFTDSLSKTLFNQYQQWYYISDFWIAFCDYALGNDDAALAGFRTYNDRADQFQEQLKFLNRQLPPVIRIYRDFRSREFVMMLEEHQGQPAKADFDVGIEWAYGEPLTIRQSKDKVLAVLFRQPQNARGTPFLREINKFVEDNPDTFAAATFGFVPFVLNEAAKAARFDNMTKELTSLGIKFPGGFDVTENSRVFRTLNATVGTASMIIFDAEGRVAWFHVDPTSNDINVLDRVIGRLIKNR
jgi:tetratricopeptide (TPR) repeat protein